MEDSTKTQETPKSEKKLCFACTQKSTTGGIQWQDLCNDCAKKFIEK